MAPPLQQPTPMPPTTLPGAPSKSPSTQLRTPIGFSQIFKLPPIVEIMLDDDDDDDDDSVIIPITLIPNEKPINI